MTRIRSPRCQTRGCNKPQTVKWGVTRAGPVAVNTAGTEMLHTIAKATGADSARGLCNKHARREADRLWSLRVRTGRCDLAVWHQTLGVKCGGPIVACHGFRRGYAATRWALWNGFSGCSGVNQWTEDHSLEWDAFLRDAWGAEYEPRRNSALGRGWKLDLAQVIAELSA